MTSKTDHLYVRSHVKRDLLQSAGLFKTDRLVVWEYVSNGLQYVDPGINPFVKVSLDNRKKRIVVVDNGRGMDWTGLQNFFVMHGENIDRKSGRPGRGRFGTGKSAAFGIGDILRITTVKDRKRSKVELSRADVESMRTEDPIPVHTIEHEIPCTQTNGTTVEIEGIHLKTLDQAGIIRYIERHLARWPRGTTVFVNNHECEFSEPPVASTHIFNAERHIREMLGDVVLQIKVAKGPLDADVRGVSIYSNGVWYETTLAGSEGREMAQYIFGDIDVPRLEQDDSPITPFDLSRSMQLNPNNHLVQIIHAFVGQKVDQVRRELVKADKDRKVDEEARKLAAQAAEIARFINEDFNEFRQRLAKARARVSGGADLYDDTLKTSDSGDDVLFGAEVSAEIVSPIGGEGSIGEDGEGGEEPRNLMPQVSPGSPDGDKQGRQASRSGDRKQTGGGFAVRFDHMGEAEHRAKYVRDERTIYINLDHPQVAAAQGFGSIEDPAFRRLSYEVAFSEYSIALASELAARDEYLDPSDPIVDIRETINRIARKGAALYSS